MDFFQIGNVLMVFFVGINLFMYSFGLINLSSDQALFGFIPTPTATSFNPNTANNLQNYLQKNLSSSGSVTASGQTTPLPQSQIIQQSLQGGASIFAFSTLLPFWGIYSLTIASFPAQITFFWGGFLLFIQGVYLLFLGFEVWKALPRGGN